MWAWTFREHLPLGKMSVIAALVTIVTVIYVLSFLFCGIANRKLAEVSSDMVKDLRRDIDGKMHRMKLNYYDTRTNGEILSVITNDVDAINTLLNGRTSFVIAHRLSTIRDAHAILYMENGDIKEVGNHETLMAMNGKYAALYNSEFA